MNYKFFKDAVLWGAGLWLFGYVLGMLFFAFVPKNQIGWWVMPLGILATLWVLWRKVKRGSVGYYLGVGAVWAVLAVLLDWLFIVKALNAADYYKFDVYLYYILTLLIPVAFGLLRREEPAQLS
jgi:hypothetical protein